MYVCPWCGLSEFESHGNEIECKRCRRRVSYGTDKRLSGVGFSFPFEFVAQWYDYQESFVLALDPGDWTEKPMYTDSADLYEVIVYERKRRLRRGAAVRLYGDRVTIDEGSENELVFPFESVGALSVLGRNKLNIYHGGKVYQLKSGKRFNALKYVNIYHRSKNKSRGDKGGKFLGL